MTREKHEYADVRVGDLVEVEIYELLTRGRVFGHLDGNLWIRGGDMLTDYRSEGFTLRIIERAVPPLPKVPGLYLDRDDDVWQLHTTDKWDCLGKDKDVRPSQVAIYLPLRRLVPEVSA